jgi:hypothetical protein
LGRIQAYQREADDHRGRRAMTRRQRVQLTGTCPPADIARLASDTVRA